MITPDERALIAEHACIPEHLPHYVNAISRTEPHLIGDFVVHVAGAQLVFVGYPLKGKFNETRLLEALDEAKARFEPSLISILAPALPSTLEACEPSPADEYHRLELLPLRIPKKTRNMLTRARREVSVRIGEFGREHKRLVKEFIRVHQLDNATRFIFNRLPEYAKCQTALVFNARTRGGDLVAFDVAEFGAQEYAFYMFNFRSQKHYVPGVSDLLLAYVIAQAKTQGKRYLNLGLGIDPGIAFFKKKWGAIPFLKHVTCTQETGAQGSWSEVFKRFSRL
ncbi:MAG: hypothetical protein JW963_25600 [Anaerolineales bacterium]|nr:hypothetical protein [Anaerolineales bacterium]